jgi:hypothetical protein
MCGLLAFCTNFGDRLTTSPLNRLAGLTICRDSPTTTLPIPAGMATSQRFTARTSPSCEAGLSGWIYYLLRAFFWYVCVQPCVVPADSVERLSSPSLSATSRIAMGARSSSCSTTSPYCWLSPESCLSVSLRYLHNCAFAKCVQATPTKLCQSKQSLPHPFFTCSEGTSMLRQQTCMPSLPM